MLKVRPFAATVFHKSVAGLKMETFPVRAEDYMTARRLASAYVLQVLKFKDFELRMVGS